MLRNLMASICLLLMFTLAGCVISPRRDVVTTGGGGNANFSITSTPGSQSVSAGGTATFTITVTPKNNFTGTVNLTVGGVPGSMQASFSTTTVAGGSGTATMTITTSVTTPNGNVSLTVTGTESDTGASQAITVGLSVQ